MSTANSIDALFELPLAEFTEARNALTASLKKSGKDEVAAQVKALQKPPVSAWAVNQLYWKHRDVFDRLIRVSDRVRQAPAGDRRSLYEERREVLSQLSRLASVLLQNAGHNATSDLMRRIATTLEGLSVNASKAGAPQPGRLTGDVDPPGFEALAGMMSNSKAPVVAGPKPTQPDKAMIAAAKKALSVAQARVRKSEAALKEATAMAKRAESLKRKAEEHLREAVTTFEEAAQQARAMAAENEGAVQALRDAERAVEQ